MAALLYSIDEARKKHFSSRQRPAEESAEGSSHLPSDQMPKNPDSVERIHNCINGEKKTDSNESASDRVILEKIQQLKIATKKPPLDKSASLPLPSPLIKPIFPPCRKCLKQVYPQERIQTSPHIWYHTSCFKCFECNLKLNLNTYYRTPLTLGDHKVFCKSHVPTLAPGHAPGKVGHAPSAQTCAAQERIVVKGEKKGLRYF